MAVIYTVTRLPFQYEKLGFGGTSLTSLQVQYAEAYYPHIAMSWTNTMSASTVTADPLATTYIYEYDPHFAMNWDGTHNLSTSTIAATPVVDSHIRLDWRNPAWGDTLQVPGWKNVIGTINTVIQPRPATFQETGIRALLWSGQNINTCAVINTPKATQYQEVGSRALLWSGQNIYQTAAINTPRTSSFAEQGTRAVLWSGSNVYQSVNIQPTGSNFQQLTKTNLSTSFDNPTLAITCNDISYTPFTNTNVTQTIFNDKPVVAFVANAILNYPAPFQLTSTPFTITAEFYATAFAGPTTAIAIVTHSAGLAVTSGTANSTLTSGWGITVAANAARQIIFTYKGGQLQGTSTVTINKWYTVEVSRTAAGVLTLKVNGVVENTSNIGGATMEAISDVLCIGKTSTNLYAYLGYISNVSITSE